MKLSHALRDLAFLARNQYAFAALPSLLFSTSHSLRKKVLFPLQFGFLGASLLLKYFSVALFFIVLRSLTNGCVRPRATANALHT